MSDFLYVQDVKLFHDKFGLETPPAFVKLPDSLHDFRSDFFREELKEYSDAVQQNDLPTTLDSLIDLVYIISGASLLHGIDADELYAAMAIVDDFFVDDAVLRPSAPEDEPTKIGFPPAEVASEFCAIMDNHIATYDQVHHAQELPLAARHNYVKFTLAAMFNSCLTAAGYQGCTNELWAELWADVQRANMSKERALKASDSKRGSTWDVVKPTGWVGPQTEAIIAKHQAL